MDEDIFILEIISMNWLTEDEPEIDLCAHGQVKVQINDEVICGEMNDEGWNLRASAIHLLRTLDRNHKFNNSFGDKLLPFDGHHVDHLDHEEEVHIQGSPVGIDWNVTHVNDYVIIESENGNHAKLHFNKYKNIILEYTDKIEKFYKDSKPKIIPGDDYDRIGNEKLWQEWHTKRSKWSYSNIT